MSELLKTIATKKILEKLSEQDRDAVDGLFTQAFTNVLQDPNNAKFLQKDWVDRPRNENISRLRAYEDLAIKVYSLGASSFHWDVGVQMIGGAMVDIVYDQFNGLITDRAGWEEGMWHRTLLLANHHHRPPGTVDELKGEPFLDFDGKFRRAKVSGDGKSVIVEEE